MAYCCFHMWTYNQSTIAYVKAFASQSESFIVYVQIDRMHKWRPKKYSFVYVLISLTSLVSTDKIQKKSSFRMRLVGLINTKTKEY